MPIPVLTRHGRHARAYLAAALLTTALCAVALPASALADGYLVAPSEQLTPSEELSPGGKDDGMVSPDATRMNGTFDCSVPWATVANKPSGYAIGNCGYGIHLHRTLKSDPVDTGYYDGGEIFGNYAGCGWIGTGSSTAHNTTDVWGNCYPTAGQSDGSFWQFTDGCSGTSSCSGTNRANPASCTAYGNFRPWRSGQNPTDYLRTIPANATYLGAPRLNWRYVTKYSAANGSGQYVMVRDRATAPGSGNWVFVRRSCMGL